MDVGVMLPGQQTRNTTISPRFTTHKALQMLQVSSQLSPLRLPRIVCRKQFSYQLNIRKYSHTVDLCAAFTFGVLILAYRFLAFILYGGVQFMLLTAGISTGVSKGSLMVKHTETENRELVQVQINHSSAPPTRQAASVPQAIFHY